MRQLKDWGAIASNASAVITLRVWDKDQTLVGLFTVQIPQTAAMLSACVWSGSGWLDTFYGAEVTAISNGPVYSAPLDDLSVLTTTSGETLVVGFQMGTSGVKPGQSAPDPYAGSGGGGAWGDITGTLSAQTDLQSALDGKAATSHTHTASQISDSTTAGRALLTAANAGAQRTALGLGTLATQSSVLSTDISDSTTAGRALLTAANAGAQRTALALGTVAVLNIDTDGTLNANSDSIIATQKAIKTYIDASFAANDAMIFKGATDCSANPNYPAANRGETYRVSVAGKIGGASGVNVEAGDIFICNTDSTASGNQATVGTAWNVIQTNLDGAVIGPASATDGGLVRFNGTTGKLIKATSATIATADVDNNAVTYAKIQTVSNKTFLGRNTASTGTVEEVTLTQLLDWVGTTARGDLLFKGASTWSRLAAGTAGQILKTGGTSADPAWADNVAGIEFNIDGGGAAITTGIKLDIEIPFACTIVGWTLLADQSTSTVVNVWKDTYANFPPDVSDKVTASAPPTITTATKGQSSTLTGWTTAIAAGDVIRINVDSNNNAQKLCLSLKVVKS